MAAVIRLITSAVTCSGGAEPPPGIAITPTVVSCCTTHTTSGPEATSADAGSTPAGVVTRYAGPAHAANDFRIRLTALLASAAEANWPYSWSPLAPRLLPVALAALPSQLSTHGTWSTDPEPASCRHPLCQPATAWENS